MKQAIAAISLLVPDYDEAIKYYTTVLGFELLEDVPLAGGKRWVRVAPSRAPGAALLLARASGADQQSCIGNQTGGRVFLFLHTDDFQRDHCAYLSRGVVFVGETRTEPYGRVAVFRDRYGNLWDLIEPANSVA